MLGLCAHQCSSLVLYLGRELLRYLWVVRISRGTFSKGHYNEQLEELLLLQLDEISLQGAIAWSPLQSRLHIDQALGATWSKRSIKINTDRGEIWCTCYQDTDYNYKNYFQYIVITFLGLSETRTT